MIRIRMFINAINESKLLFLILSVPGLASYLARLSSFLIGDPGSVKAENPSPKDLSNVYFLHHWLPQTNCNLFVELPQLC